MSIGLSLTSVGSVGREREGRTFTSRDRLNLGRREELLILTVDDSLSMPASESCASTFGSYGSVVPRNRSSRSSNGSLRARFRRGEL